MSKQRTNKSTRPASSRPFSSDKPAKKSSSRSDSSSTRSEKPSSRSGSGTKKSFSKKDSFGSSFSKSTSKPSRSTSPRKEGGSERREERSFQPKRSDNASGKKAYRDKKSDNYTDRPKKTFRSKSDNHDSFKEKRGSFSDKPKTRSSSSSSFRKEESTFSDRPKKPFRSKEEGSETFKERRTATSDRPRKVYRDTDSSAPEGRRSYSSKNTKEERSTAFDKKARPERSSGGYKKDIKKSFDSDDLKKGRKSYSKKIDRIGKGKKYTPSKQSEDSSIRLNKYISNSGICSRREADQLIIEGLVQVNGVVITELGHKVQPGDSVKYNNKVIRPESLVYVLLNKPKDFITTMDDEGGRKTVMDLVANATKERIFPVGRLDRNTTGLLLLTNDGELTQKLTHPSFKIKKIYEVELNESITPEEFERLQKSHITLYDGPVKIDDIAIISPNRKILGIEIHEGRNRIVRRVFESLGKEVVRLDRVMYAGLTKKNLPRGKWRFLTNSEVNQMKYLL